MVDPVISAFIVAGVKRLGSTAREWAKGDATQQLAVALAGRLAEDEFRLLNFESLERDDQFRQFVEEARKTQAFDERRA